MALTRIKICGVRDIHAAMACANAGVNAIGLVFVPGSPRYVTVQTARQIVRHLPAFVEPVGLFVNASAQQIKKTAAEVGLRQVQLHGSETPELASDLAPLSVVKALPFNAEFSARVTAWLNQSTKEAPLTSGLIIDSPPPANHTPGQAGGMGATFDWFALKSHLETLDAGQLPPIILAGGLTPANVGQAVGVLQPYAVDVSSGVESERGVKSVELIDAFCRAVRAADRSLSTSR
jgi:phosphoribosylanthranilate isomerase